MQTEMANAHKAAGQNVGEEAADKLHRRERHQLLFAVVAVIEILEGDRVFPNRHNAMIGNGNAEDVATEILDQLLDAVERGLDIHFPIFRQGFRQHPLNIQRASLGIQFAIRPKLRERKTKAVAELIGKQFDGKEKFVRSRLPAKAPHAICGVASGGGHKGAARDNEVEMQMLLHGLTPGMQDHRKANLAAEIFLPELFEQLRGNLNEQVIHQLLVAPNQGIEDMVYCENHMVIRNGEKPFLLRFEPLRFLKRTTRRTMAVLAGFVVEFPAFALGTFQDHAAEGRRVAIQNRAHGFGLLIRKPMRALVLADMLAEDISDFVARTL